MGSGKIFSSLKYGCCLLVVEVALKLSHSPFLKSTCMCIVINHDSIPVVIDNNVNYHIGISFIILE